MARSNVSGAAWRVNDGFVLTEPRFRGLQQELNSAEEQIAPGNGVAETIAQFGRFTMSDREAAKSADEQRSTRRNSAARILENVHPEECMGQFALEPMNRSLGWGAPSAVHSRDGLLKCSPGGPVRALYDVPISNASCDVRASSST